MALPMNSKTNPLAMDRLMVFTGNANPRMDVPNDPNKQGLHSRSRLYRPDPPVMTYRLLKQIVTSLRDIGREMTGKPIRIGTTFDPGGEFARLGEQLHGPRLQELYAHYELLDEVRPKHQLDD